MKRIFFTFLFILALLFPYTAVYADAIIGNDFLQMNKRNTEALNRSFYTNGVDGYVSAKKSPGSRTELRQVGNNIIIYIGYIYLHRGRYWGTWPDGHTSYDPGWVLMDELLMIYENKDFEAEYRNELFEYSGGFDKLLDADAFYYWQWPGSDREKILYPLPESDNPDYSDDIYYDSGGIQFYGITLEAKHAYIDDESREWVYIVLRGGWPGGFHRGPGFSYGWVCMDDPDNDQIPSFKPAPDPIPWSRAEVLDWYGTFPLQDSDTRAGPGIDRPMAIIIAVVAAAVIMALIFVRRRFYKA